MINLLADRAVIEHLSYKAKNEFIREIVIYTCDIIVAE